MAEDNPATAGVAPDLRAPLLKIASDPLAAMMGVELLEVAPGRARVALTLEKRHLNSLGSAHGATIFSLADQAFALASNSHGQVAVALNVNINFVAPAGAGDRLIAEASELHRGGRTALYRLEVRTEDGKLIASSQGLAYRRREALADMQPEL